MENVAIVAFFVAAAAIAVWVWLAVRGEDAECVCQPKTAPL
jgi:hypothetical protein